MWVRLESVSEKCNLKRNYFDQSFSFFLLFPFSLFFLFLNFGVPEIYYDETCKTLVAKLKVPTRCLFNKNGLAVVVL